MTLGITNLELLPVFGSQPPQVRCGHPRGWSHLAGNQRLIPKSSQPALLAVLGEAWKGALSVQRCVNNREAFRGLEVTSWGGGGSRRSLSKESLECALS